jgi:hypothetical protein
MKKQILLLLTAILLSTTSSFAQGGTTGPLTWNVGNGALTISGEGDMPNYDNNDAPWNSYREFIFSIILEPGVSGIGNKAFWNLYRSTSVSIPNSITKIGEDAFTYCTGLTSITIPNSVTYIGKSAFFSCSSLASVTLSNKITNINEDTFSCCFNLSSIIIPNSVTNIGNAAFFNCRSLTSIIIPNSVTSIVGAAFSYCENLSLIINHNPIPVDLDQWAFYEVDKSVCVLRVPTNAVQSYQNAEVWKWFNIILGGVILVNPIANNSEYGYTSGETFYDINTTATVTATANFGYKFVNWTKDGVEISTNNPYSFMVTEDTELIANFEEEVGIESLEISTVKIYPNPTAGMLKIESELGIESVVIYDIFGKIRKIENRKFENIIDISHLSAGVYFVKISTKAGEVTKKVVKE